MPRTLFLMTRKKRQCGRFAINFLFCR